MFVCWAYYKNLLYNYGYLFKISLMVGEGVLTYLRVLLPKHTTKTTTTTTIINHYRCQRLTYPFLSVVSHILGDRMRPVIGASILYICSDNITPTEGEVTKVSILYIYFFWERGTRKIGFCCYLYLLSSFTLIFFKKRS